MTTPNETKALRPDAEASATVASSVAAPMLANAEPAPDAALPKTQPADGSKIQPTEAASAHESVSTAASHRAPDVLHPTAQGPDAASKAEQAPIPAAPSGEAETPAKPKRSRKPKAVPEPAPFGLQLSPKAALCAVLAAVLFAGLSFGLVLAHLLPQPILRLEQASLAGTALVAPPSTDIGVPQVPLDEQQGRLNNAGQTETQNLTVRHGPEDWRTKTPPNPAPTPQASIPLPPDLAPQPQAAPALPPAFPSQPSFPLSSQAFFQTFPVSQFQPIVPALQPFMVWPGSGQIVLQSPVSPMQAHPAQSFAQPSPWQAEGMQARGQQQEKTLLPERSQAGTISHGIQPSPHEQAGATPLSSQASPLAQLSTSGITQAARMPQASTSVPFARPEGSTTSQPAQIRPVQEHPAPNHAQSAAHFPPVAEEMVEKSLKELADFPKISAEALSQLLAAVPAIHLNGTPETSTQRLTLLLSPTCPACTITEQLFAACAKSGNLLFAVDMVPAGTDEAIATWLETHAGPRLDAPSLAKASETSLAFLATATGETKVPTFCWTDGDDVCAGVLTPAQMTVLAAKLNAAVLSEQAKAGTAIVLPEKAAPTGDSTSSGRTADASPHSPLPPSAAQEAPDNASSAAAPTADIATSTVTVDVPDTQPSVATEDTPEVDAGSGEQAAHMPPEQ